MQTKGLQTFLSEGHISYYRPYRGPGVLRNVIVLGYVSFCQINKILVIWIHLLKKWFQGRIWPVGRSLETPDVDYVKELCQHPPLSESNTNGARL